MTTEQVQKANLSPKLKEVVLTLLEQAKVNEGQRGIRQSYNHILLHLTKLFPDEKREIKQLFDDAKQAPKRTNGTPRVSAASMLSTPAGGVSKPCADCPGNTVEPTSSGAGIKVQPLGGNKVSQDEETEVTVPAHLYEDGELEEKAEQVGQEQTEDDTPAIGVEELTPESDEEDVLIAHGKGIVTDTEVANNLKATMDGLGIEYSKRASKLETLAGYYLDHLKYVRSA
jgi:hypothetical protein